MTVEQHQRTGTDTDAAWDRYWSSNRIAACFNDENGRYSAAFDAQWRKVFSQQRQGARIVDLCSGNGAVALIAGEISDNESLEFEIHGVDRASIDPTAYIDAPPEVLAAIRFYPRTNCERLPFEPRSIDLAVSQYGLEYTDLAGSVRELTRVLRGDGQLVCICHAAEGVVARAAREELDNLARIEDAGLLSLAREMLERVLELERGQRPPPAAREKAFFEVRTRYQTAVAGMKRRLAATRTAPVLGHTISVFEHAFNHRRHFEAGDLLAKLDELNAEMRAHRSRVANLASVALDEMALSRINNLLADAGFSAISSDSLTLPDEGLIGYLLQARLDSSSL